MEDNKGFIKLIILVIIGLVVLKFFFSFDVIDYLKTPEVQSFFSKVKEVIIVVWNFIYKIVSFAWESGKKLVLEAIEISRNISDKQ